MSILRNVCYDPVFRFLPAFIIYVNFSGDFAGKTIGPFILIKPKYRDDEGLREHEKVHVKHSYIGLIIIHALLYRFSDRFRYWAELQAYRVQLTYGKPDKLDYLAKKFARFIVDRYRLDVTFSQALSDLIG